MLAVLRIQNLAIVDRVELALGPGLNVLTGETGAGKSLVVTAAEILRGARSSSDLVRAGANEAVVEAIFDLADRSDVRSMLDECGIPRQEEELLVRRVIARRGRSRVYLNGTLCTTAMLSKIAQPLLEISGQHQTQRLTDSSAQRAIVDAFGSLEGSLSAVRSAHDRIQELADQLSRTELDERERVERIDYLKFQIEEIEQARLRLGEDGELEQSLPRLRRASDLRRVAEGAESCLYSSEGSITESIGRLEQQFGGLKGVDKELDGYAAQVVEARVVLEDVGTALGRYATGVDVDPQALEQGTERLAQIDRLKRKYGREVETILDRLTSMRDELDQLQSLDSHRQQLEQDLRQARLEAEAVAGRLTSEREQAAETIGRLVTQRLRQLKMERAAFSIVVKPMPARVGDAAAFVFRDGTTGESRRLNAEGWDNIEMSVAPNGAASAPLKRVASGGELSRIMLALQRTVGECHSVGTSIFDEVDSGIGGAVADVVGKDLARVGRERQALVVTHLPQVAAYATHHFRVSKVSLSSAASGQKREPTTISEVRKLSEKERVEELARMLAASRVTAQARAHARQLLSAVQTDQRRA